MSSRSKIIVGAVVLLILFGGGFMYFQNRTNVSDLEQTLRDTAWVQIDPNGETTDFEIDFRDTKENDPTHASYDYQDYLHQRPGESGYWKVENNTITIIGNPSDVPPIVYTNVKIEGTILIMSDALDGTVIRFKKFP